MEEIQEKLNSQMMRIQDEIKRKDGLVKAYVGAYQFLLLGDKERYPLLQKLKEHLKKESLSAFLLAEIHTEALSDHAKMECITRFKNGTIFMIAGDKPGTATEVTNILKTKHLRHRVVLFFEGSDYPPIAFSEKDYTAYFPRKYYFRNEERLFGLVLAMAKQDAYAEANIWAQEVSDSEEKG